MKWEKKWDEEEEEKRRRGRRRRRRKEEDEEEEEEESAGETETAVTIISPIHSTLSSSPSYAIRHLLAKGRIRRGQIIQRDRPVGTTWRHTFLSNDNLKKNKDTFFSHFFGFCFFFLLHHQQSNNATTGMMNEPMNRFRIHSGLDFGITCKEKALEDAEDEEEIDCKTERRESDWESEMESSDEDEVEYEVEDFVIGERTFSVTTIAYMWVLLPACHSVSSVTSIVPLSVF